MLKLQALHPDTQPVSLREQCCQNHLYTVSDHHHIVNTTFILLAIILNSTSNFSRDGKHLSLPSWQRSWTSSLQPPLISNNLQAAVCFISHLHQTALHMPGVFPALCYSDMFILVWDYGLWNNTQTRERGTKLSRAVTKIATNIKVLLKTTINHKPRVA